MAIMQLYSGKTWHQRFLPKSHGFVYGYNMWGFWLADSNGLNSNVPNSNISGLDNGLNKGLDESKADLGLPDTWWFSAKRKLTLNRFNLADYLPEQHSQNKKNNQNKKNSQDQNTLAEKVKNKLFALTQEMVTGQVLALVNVRTLGYYFSPVNFYIGFDADHNPSHLLAEVSNTPWNETHYYGFLLTGKHTQYSHAKAFKVSPFNAVNERYDWLVSVTKDRHKNRNKNLDRNLNNSPDIKQDTQSDTDKKMADANIGITNNNKSDVAENIRIVISLHTEQGRVFHAGVNLAEHDLSGLSKQNLPKQALQSLAENQLTFARIYWQAFKLFAIKKIPYVAYTPLKKTKPV